MNYGIEPFLKLLILNKIYQKKNYTNIDFKIFIELYFHKKIFRDSKINFINHFLYFNKKYYEFKKYNLDLEIFFIELNAKVLNE